MENTTEQHEEDAPRTVFRVPVEKLEHLRGKIEQLNKRARKTGCAPIIFEDLRTEFDPVYLNSDGVRVSKGAPGARLSDLVDEFHIVHVEGESPKFAGWRLVGTLEHDDGMTILKAVPGAELKEYRGASPVCDHCKAKRQRHDTFVVEHDDGRRAQVGRNCIADFLGRGTPEGFAKAAEYLFLAMSFAFEAEEHMDGDRSPYRVDLERFLGFVSASIALDGWVSRTAARESSTVERSVTATADTVMRILTSTLKSRHDREDYDRLRAAYREEKAKAALAWALSLVDKPGASDFEYNVATVAQLGSVAGKTAGIAAAIVSSHERSVSRAMQAKRRIEAEKNSRYFGEVGKRAHYALTVTFHTSWESDYGVTHLYKFVDDAGNIACWRSSRYIEAFEELGAVFMIKGTVKRHEEYKGVKETSLTRCEVVDKLAGADGVVVPAEVAA